MANLSFAIRSSLGFLPKTEKIESSKQKLEEDYNKLKAIESSEELKEFYELKEYVESPDFINNKKQILALNFKNTDEAAKEMRFKKLQKNKSIVHYFKMLNSEQYKNFQNTEQSQELSEFTSLEVLINSNEHINKKDTLTTALKSELDKEKEYIKLKKTKNIKNYLRVINLETFQNYERIDGSEELSHYNTLQEFALSSDLANIKAEIKAKAKEDNPVNYADTDEAAKEQEYKSLKDSDTFKLYFKFIKSKEYKIYQNVNDSAELARYYELEKYILSDDFKQAIISVTFENTEEFNNEIKYNELRQNDSIKSYLKFKNSKSYAQFIETSNGELLKEYLSLEEYNKSEEFIDFKSYMLDKDKFSKTEDFTKESKYKELEGNTEIKWYLATKDSQKFKYLFDWNLTFEDDFTSSKVDDTQWMNSFFWGKMLINDRYVIAGEKHYYSENKNTEINNSVLSIVTRNEKAKGKVWHPLHGFSEQDFNYTSGMLSSANSFRQKYGKFEAKIKLDANYPAYQAFWLKGEKISPEIDVFKFNMDKRNRMQLANHEINSNNNTISATSKLNGSPFTKGFFIYTLEWTPEKISWFINGIEIYQCTENIPNEALYILFSAGINQDPKDANINSSFEIDWVRCYEKAN